MSWDFTLVDPVSREPLYTDTPHMMRGGTYSPGGTNELWLNVTYNYSIWYCMTGVFPYDNGIRGLDGVTAVDSIPIIRNAIQTLIEMDEDKANDMEMHIRDCYKDMKPDDYWLPTRQHAIRPLYQLLAMAQMRPDGVWEVM